MKLSEAILLAAAYVSVQGAANATRTNVRENKSHTTVMSAVAARRSLDETVRWLQGTINEYGWRIDSVDGTPSMRCDRIGATSIRLRMVDLYPNGRAFVDDRKMSLKDLDPNGVRVSLVHNSIAGDSWNIGFGCVGGRYKMTCDSYWLDNRGRRTNPQWHEKWPNFNIRFLDRDLAKRVASALQRACRLARLVKEFH